MMSLQARRVLWGFIAAAALALSAEIGHASTIPGSSTSGASNESLYSGSKLVVGASASVVQLDIPSAGTLTLTWTDLDFSSSLAALEVGLSDASKTLGDYDYDGSTTVDLSGPLMLYATVFATAQGSMDVGLYHLSATFTPAVVATVPLPGLGVSGLGVGFLGVLAIAWRRRRRLLINRLEAILGAGLLGLLALGWRRGWRQPDFSGSVYEIVTTPVA
jgi:hypothetical protein